MNEPNERKKFYELKINQAIKNFKKRQFEAEYFETSDKLVEFLFSQFKKEDVIGYGGSKSVYGLDIIEKLKDSDYILLDRTHPENTPEKKAEIERKCFSANIFLASATAVSEEGAIVNIDLYGNRVSAISFGPEKVYLVIGRNKLCTDLEKAIHRARNYASPMNAIRFGKNTPCTKTGQCSDCSSEDRICGTVSIVEWCAIKSRIHLLFVNEDLGF